MHALEIIWEIFFCSFSSFTYFFCVKRPEGVFRDVRTVIPYVRMVFLVVRTIRLIRPDIHSSCLDELVFVTSTWHYIRTSFKFRPDGEPYRVKSHSPLAAAHIFAPFGSFCRLVHCLYAFYA
jgi:hypothetical protein